MRRGFGVGWFVLIGLAILFFIPSGTYATDLNGPRMELRSQMPIRANDVVLLQGYGFKAQERLTGFGIVAQVQNEEPFYYHAFPISQEAMANDLGEFQIEVPLQLPPGIRGYIELTLIYEGRLVATEFQLVQDPGIYHRWESDATTGTLKFDDTSFNHGGSGEDPVANSDDAPLTSNGSGGWTGDIIQVNLERYTTTDATGTSTPYGNITNDVGFDGGNNLTAGSSAIVAGLNSTYKSIRMTILVWDTGYINFASATTIGASQGADWLSTADVTAPTVQSAVAISLTQIKITFSENVTTPALNADAIDNWTVTFNGAKAVSALTPLGSANTSVCTLTVANLGDYGATPSVDFTTGTDEFEDAAGNDCSTGSVVATDGIAPAIPTLTAPDSTTLMAGSAVNWSATAGAGSDVSFWRIKFQGSNNLTSWTDLDSSVGPTYSGTYTFGTRWSYFRALAQDVSENSTGSANSGNCQAAQFLDLSTIPASTPVNVESHVWTVSVTDCYGNLENVTQTVGLASSTSGTFRPTPGGSPIGSLNFLNVSSMNFYYISSIIGTRQITVSNAVLQDDFTDYVVTAGSASKLLIKLPGQSFSNGVGIIGTADFSSYGGNVGWARAGTAFPITTIVVDAGNNIILSENGTRTIDFTTTSDSSPNGTNPVINGTAFPVSGLSVNFTDGESSTSLMVTLYNFTKTYVRDNIGASDDPLTGDASSGMFIRFANADHLDWTNSSGIVTTTPVNSTRTVNVALPTFYVTALDAYDNRDTTYTGSTITVLGGSVNAPTNSPAGKGQGGTSLPGGNTPPSYGSNTTWSKGTLTLLSSNVSQQTIIYTATTDGFQIRAQATGGTLTGLYTPNSDLFDVNYGSLNYVRIEDTAGGTGSEYNPGSSISTSDTRTYYSVGYDQWGNTRGDQTVTWSSSNLTPAASGNSTYWDFAPTAATTNGSLTADAPSGTDRTISPIVVTVDESITSIKIRNAEGGGGAEVTTIEVAGSANGNNYNVSDTLWAGGYNGDNIYISDVNATWAITANLPTTGGSGFSTPAANARQWTADTTATVTGYIIATFNALTDSTGLVRVDATRPAIVQGFNIVQDNNDNFYVFAYWNPNSSFDDGSNSGSGNVGDFDIRFSAVKCSTEALWNAATSVGIINKPVSFNQASSWHIYMAPFPAGNYFYAIKTQDPQGYWSLIGSGCFTTSSDFSLPVTLSTFTARGGYGKITVDWSTESEVDALGFRLYRDTSPDFENPVVVTSYETNPELACQGTSELGFDYTFTDRSELMPDCVYYYLLESVDVNGRTEQSSSTAQAAALALPTDYVLEQNYPNPFNPTTHFNLKLPESSEVTVVIYDAMGREVRRVLDHQKMDADVYSLSWDGANAAGFAMPSGIYFCRLQAASNNRIIKMLLLK
ncbi:MAG: T9SS type A sorting domain-containing protein [bacterium]|nr:T9SS type A sorting domain-containing protein [bacterium]